MNVPCIRFLALACLVTCATAASAAKTTTVTVPDVRCVAAAVARTVGVGFDVLTKDCFAVPPSAVQRTWRVSNAAPATAAFRLRQLFLLEDFQVEVGEDGLVATGAPEVIDRAEAELAKLDQPKGA